MIVHAVRGFAQKASALGLGCRIAEEFSDEDSHDTQTNAYF